MTDLCNDLSLRRLHRDLEIARNRIYVISYKSITPAHSVQTVLQPEILGAALQHRLSHV